MSPSVIPSTAILLTVILPLKIVSLVNVLAPPILCVPVVLTTVLSTATEPLLISIPSPPLKCALTSAALGPV